MNTYNNNQRDNQVTNTTYSPISFANSESKVAKSRFSIEYFNRLMKITIAEMNPQNANDTYPTFDKDNAAVVYLSYTNAKILHDLIVEKLLKDDKVHNVCVETNKGLLKVSDGVEFGAESPCISIMTDDNGNIKETIYQTKTKYYNGALNYSKGKFESEYFDDMELNTFIMTLEEYFTASSYAIPALVQESGMYKRNYQYKLIKAIADKVGVQSGSYSNKSSFLRGNNEHTNAQYDNGDSSLNGEIPEGYEASTFEDIANNMK